MKNVILILYSLLIISCKENKSNIDQTTAPTGDKALTYYGETFDLSTPRSVDETLQELKSNDSIMTQVSGYVTSVCQVKGCWMVLSQNPTDTTGLFVKFKDYGFFVPLDFSGSKVTLSGKAFKEITSVDELKHYAEDEGKSPEEIALITQPAEENKFLANGVAVIASNK